MDIDWRKQGRLKQMLNFIIEELYVIWDRRNLIKRDLILLLLLIWIRIIDNRGKIWWMRWRYWRRSRKWSRKRCFKSFSNDLVIILQLVFTTLILSIFQVMFIQSKCRIHQPTILELQLIFHFSLFELDFLASILIFYCLYSFCRTKKLI